MSSDDIKRMVAENAALKAQNTSLLDEVAGLRSRLDQLIGLAAGQNDRLADLTAMLRRREDQLRRGERKSDDDEPDGPRARTNLIRERLTMFYKEAGR